MFRVVIHRNMFTHKDQQQGDMWTAEGRDTGIRLALLVFFAHIRVDPVLLTHTKVVEVKVAL